MISQLEQYLLYQDTGDINMKTEILKILKDSRRHWIVTMPELFRSVAAPRGRSIGQFHDDIRSLADAGAIVLHPWTGPMYQLQDEQYALLKGQEIKYYVELVRV